MKINQLLVPFYLQASCPLEPAKKIHEEAKICSPEVRSCDSTCLSHFSHCFELQHLIITVARAALYLYTFNQFFLFCEQ